jgi:hypothetical protein
MTILCHTEPLAGDATWEDIYHKVGLASRSPVKRFLTIATGASDKLSEKIRLQINSFN